MALPATHGWLVDYVTAKRVFESADNALINALTGMCETGDLHFCSCEVADFRKHLKLRPPFIDDNQCRIDMSEAIIGRVQAIIHNYHSKPFIIGDRTTKIIVATALEHDFGILSDRSTANFATPLEVADELNVVGLTSAQFKGAL